MDESLSKARGRIITPPSDFEAKCLQQLGGAIYKWCIKDDSVVTQHLASFKQAVKLDREKTGKSSADDVEADCDDVNPKNILDLLENTGGLLLVVCLPSKLCVYAEVSPSLTIEKSEIIGKCVDEFVHKQDRSTFNNTMLTRSRLGVSGHDIKTLSTTTRFQRKPKHTDSTSLSTPDDCYVTMKCIGFVEHLKGEPLLKEEEESDFLICVASPPRDENNNNEPSAKGPPNQTVTTRVEIPRPQRFYTRHSMEGRIEAVALDLAAVLKAAPPPLPAALKDVIGRCIKSFITPRGRGGGAAKEESLQKRLQNEVLKQGSVAGARHRFYLKDMSVATSLTQSKLAKRGNSPCVVMIHDVCRDGSSTGIDRPQPQTRLLPLSMETAPGCEAVTTATTTTVATTCSFSSGSISNHVTNPTMSIGQAGSYANDPYSSWQRGGRNSLDFTQEVLAQVDRPEVGFEGMNGVVSPPPHLDGYLVHTIGAHNTPASEWRATGGKTSLPTTAPSNLPIATSQGPQTCAASMPSSNPATFPGPPCIDLSRFEISSKDGTLVPMSSASVTPMYVNGITTMRKDAVVTTTTLPESRSALNREVSAALGDRVLTPPDNSTLHRSPLPKRPRSASTNASAPTTNPLKRSSSTLSEDSGIDETSFKGKPFPVQRSKSKDKLKAAVKKNKILSTLLHAKSTDSPEVLSQSLERQHSLPATNGGPPGAVPPLSVTSSGASSLFQATSMSPPAISRLAPSAGTPSFSGSVSPPKFTTVAPTPQRPPSRQFSSVSTSVSPEEAQELDEIFQSMPDLFTKEEAPSRRATFDPSSPQFPATADVTRGTGPMLRQTSGTSLSNIPELSLSSNHLGPSNMMMSPVGRNLNQSAMPPSQQIMTSPTGQGYINNGGNNLVPMRSETCPNRVVSSAGAISPRPPQPPSTSHYRGGYVAPDNWAGDEPLVDLGTDPPPAGINPRMAIPVPANMNVPVNRSNPAHPRPMMHSQQNGMAGLPFQSPNTRPVRPMLMEATMRPNPMMASSVSPSNLPQSRVGRPATVYGNRPAQSSMLASATSARPSMTGQPMQQQSQVLPPMQGGYNNDMGIPGGNMQHPLKPDMTRFLGQRRNGALSKPQKGISPAQHPVLSPSGQNIYPPMNSQHLVQGPPQQFSSSLKPGGYFHKQPPMQDQFRPSIPPYDPQLLRPNNAMNPQTPPRFNGGAYNVAPMGGGNAGNSSSVAKQPAKRPRNVKPRKRSKQGDAPPQFDDVTDAKQRLRPQIIGGGGTQDRPQAAFNSTLNGAVGTTILPLSGQQFNLNSLMSESPKQNKVTFNVPATSSSTSVWSELDDLNSVIGMSSSSFSNGMLPDILDETSTASSLPLSNGFDSHLLPSVPDGDLCNSNLNNNNYSSQSFLTTSSSGGDVTVPSAAARAKRKRRNTTLLETLLLKNDA